MRSLPIETAGLIQKTCGIWIVSQIYLVALIWIFDLFFFLMKPYFRRFNEKLTRKIKLMCFTCICILIGVGLTFGYYNFTHPVIKNYSFDFNRTSFGVVSDYVAAESTYKMLVASDLHLGYIVDVRMLKKYVSLINDQHPDIVVIDGDLIDWNLYPLVESNMQEELKKIKASKGVYFVPGNHEYKFDIDAALAWITQSGMTVLKDTIVSIDNKLWLIGRDDKKNENKKPVDEFINGFNTTSEPCIMLVHRPENIKEALEYNIPLVICGHTHYGQIFPANLLAHLFYSNPYGWKKINGCYSCTTSGLGLSGFPLRIGSRSEAIVFDIRIY